MMDVTLKGMACRSLCVAVWITVNSAIAIDTNDVIKAVSRPVEDNATYAAITINYPFDETVFPLDLVAPTFYWSDTTSGVDYWLFEFSSDKDTVPLYALNSGDRNIPEVDLEAKEVAGHDFKDPDPISQYAWTPEDSLWEKIKQQAGVDGGKVTIYGISSANEYEILSLAELQFSISSDPVGAPIFYRDVPLLPKMSLDKKIKPIPTDALPLIKWKLRDLTKPKAKTVLGKMPTCVNCHSFSRDGNVLGMDMDGPNGDKGAYALTDVLNEIRIEEEDIITWNSYEDTPEGHNNFGLFSQVSPDGRYVVSTLNEAVFIVNYTNVSFIQSFYPTKGILVVYDKETETMRPLPGASDPKFVQSNAVWSPDGKELTFSRAPAKEAFENIQKPSYAGDPLETCIQYDLYRIPFNEGKGGKAVPVQGASKNGMSNSFPKYSPDGKWIIYVQAAKGQLMRPDSKLFIIPSEGGDARELSCNLSLMNSWHSWSPNSKWLVFSSKGFGPYTKMFLTHIDDEGNSSPAVMIPKSTADNRAVNIPEFVNGAGDVISNISAPTQRSYQLYREGSALIKEGKYKEAQALIDESLEINPYYPLANMDKGLVLIKLGKPTEALEWYKKAQKLDPDKEKIYKAIAYILLEEDNVQEAIDYLDEVLNKNPIMPETQLLIAQLYKQSGNIPKVIEHCRAGAEIPISNPMHFSTAGALLLEVNQYKDALKCFERSLVLDESQPEIHYWVGRIYQRLGNIEQALKHFNRSVELDDQSDAHYLLARFALVSGQPDQAAIHLEKFLEKRPQVVDARLALADLYSRKALMKESRAQYEKVLEFDPENVDVLTRLALLLATNADGSEQFGKAKAFALKACELTERKRANQLHALAVALAANGEFSEALELDRELLLMPEMKNDAAFSALVRMHMKLFQEGQWLSPSDLNTK